MKQKTNKVECKHTNGLVHAWDNVKHTRLFCGAEDRLLSVKESLAVKKPQKKVEKWYHIATNGNLYLVKDKDLPTPVVKECNCHCHTSCDRRALKGKFGECDTSCPHCSPVSKEKLECCKRYKELGLEDKQSWEKELKLYLTSAGDRRRTIYFIKNLLLQREKEVREKIYVKVEKIRNISPFHQGKGHDCNRCNGLDSVLQLLKERI